MTAAKAECKKGLPIVPPPSLGVFLDIDDLAQLDFLERVGKPGGLADPRQTVCLPRHEMTPELSTLLVSLEDAGRVRVKQHLAKQSLTPGRSGTIVIRPGVEDATVLETFKDVDLLSLQPLLDFQRTHPNMLQSATLFPNVSDRGLKGINLQFDPRQPCWWRTLADSKWPIARGLNTVALPMDAEEFIDTSDDLLRKISLTYRTDGSGVKYIRFYYGDTGQVFMAIAAGPDNREKEAIWQELQGIHRPKRALELMTNVERTFRERRRNCATLVNNTLGLCGKVEEVSDAPFVMMDIEGGRAVSGGVGPGSDLLPFTLGDGMIIHSDPSDRIVPFGLKRPETGTSLPQFISKDSVERFISTLNNPMILRDLTVAFHQPSQKERYNEKF